MDLMDNERAELLRVTEEGNMFQKVLTQTEQEIVSGTAKFGAIKISLLAVSPLALGALVIFTALHSCTCGHDTSNCLN